MCKLSLQQRISRVRPVKGIVPQATCLCAYDFLGVIGEMLGQSERYETIYNLKIKQYDCADGSKKSVCEMVHAAQHLSSNAQDQLLYWLLIEPFISMDRQEGGIAP